MKYANKKRQGVAKRRAQRVRKSLRGTSACPRMCVVKTNKHVYVQLIDDVTHKTVASASTCSKDFSSSSFSKKNKENAKVLGGQIAEKAKSLGISEVIFDRGASKYHGILAELADAVRQQGLFV